MSEDKQEKIKKLLEMQKKFIALDREQGVEASEYFAPDDDSEIAGFREEYRDLAMDIVDLAHNEKGCLLYTSPSPRDRYISRMPSSA